LGPAKRQHKQPNISPNEKTGKAPKTIGSGHGTHHRPATAEIGGAMVGCIDAEFFRHERKFLFLD